MELHESRQKQRGVLQCSLQDQFEALGMSSQEGLAYQKARCALQRANEVALYGSWGVISQIKRDIEREAIEAQQVCKNLEETFPQLRDTYDEIISVLTFSEE